ncbi:uncharacterized protein LOC135224780 [Macrobrachium nipponense]|uniref:uncharacterized protein LOC135224780 n=1 Tax=Macrobrachium nipponense TaxID=159736 RepID=UPI0030C7C5EF
MASFDVDKFAGNPSAELSTIQYAKKKDLLELGLRLRLPVRSNLKKSEIRNLILEHYLKAKEAELAVKVERETIELQLKAEREKSELSRLDKRQEIDLLESQKKFDLSKNMKLVPDFTDYDPEDYFRAFEETASHLNWPKEQWIWLLRPKLSGKAAQVCRHIKETNDYEVIKKAVIDAFSISVEGYRQVFRNKVKTSTQTYLEFASEKLRDFRKWLKASTITTFEQLENLIVFEEFVRKLPSHIMLYLCDRQENDLLKAASLADTYSLVHKTSKRLDHIVKQVPGNTLGVSTEESRESLLCKYCKKPGHSIKNCKAPNCKVSELNRNFKDRSFKSNPLHRDKPSLHVVKHEAVDLFEGFKIDGIGSLTSDGGEHKLKMLRDTGASQSLILRKAIPDINKALNGDFVLLRDLTRTSRAPLADIYIDCPLKKGSVGRCGR